MGMIESWQADGYEAFFRAEADSTFDLKIPINNP
jgi:hypothetical protein